MNYKNFKEGDVVIDLRDDPSVRGDLGEITKLNREYLEINWRTLGGVHQRKTESCRNYLAYESICYANLRLKNSKPLIICLQRE